MIIRKPVKQDFLNIELQDSQSFITKEMIEHWDCETILKHSSWLGEADGKILIICGAYQVHKYRIIFWAFVSKHAGKHLLQITREIKKVIDSYQNVRIEANVSPSFENGIRWVNLLGFKFEAKLSKYDEQGNDQLMYSIVKD